MEKMRIPAIGLDVRVAGMSFGSPIDPPFNPATIESLIYYDTSRGTLPGTNAGNTTYVAGHTWRGGQSAFNVIDTSLRVGDDVYVATASSRRLGAELHYVVTSQKRYLKSSLVDAREVWSITPNRIILITCNLREDGAPQSDNNVFFLDLVGTV